MEPDYRQIYATEAERYERLVAAEDWQGGLLPAINEIVSLQGAAIVEPGAGTGRLTRQLLPCARSVRALDRSGHMLQRARENLSRRPQVNWTLTLADNQALPLRSCCADIVLAGWSFGHSTVWNAAGWRQEVERAVNEMLRVLRPGGCAIILETLGVGVETPQAPTTALAAFYRYLVDERGFSQHWLRTDYRFASPAEARELLQFFFGDELARQVSLSDRCEVPECTGIWWRRV